MIAEWFVGMCHPDDVSNRLCHMASVSIAAIGLRLAPLVIRPLRSNPMFVLRSTCKAKPPIAKKPAASKHEGRTGGDNASSAKKQKRHPHAAKRGYELGELTVTALPSRRRSAPRTTTLSPDE